MARSTPRGPGLEPRAGAPESTRSACRRGRPRIVQSARPTTRLGNAARPPGSGEAVVSSVASRAQATRLRGVPGGPLVRGGRPLARTILRRGRSRTVPNVVRARARRAAPQWRRGRRREHAGRSTSPTLAESIAPMNDSRRVRASRTSSLTGSTQRSANSSSVSR